MEELNQKENELTSLTNEVKSKMKLLNQLNTQLNQKEARNSELDQLISDKEKKIKELEEEMNKNWSANQ